MGAAGWLLHGGVVVLWLLLLRQAFCSQGLSFWSTGIVYTLYDTLLIVFVASQTLRLGRPRPTAATPATRPALGVVVAAYNEANVLDETLTALLAQSDAPEQIVLADDGSSDATARMLMDNYGLPATDPGTLSAASARYPHLYWLRLPHGGKASALNAALVAIDTEVVMTVDADTLLDRDACAAMRAAFAAEPSLVAAGGVLTPHSGKGVQRRVFQTFQTYEYLRNFISRAAWSRQRSLLLISGAFAGFRRQALLDVGGFDAQCLVEDYELLHRLQRHGYEHGLPWEVRIVGNAHAVTDAPGRLPDFLRQRRRWFAGFLETQWWNRDMTGNPHYGRLGTMMLPVKALDTLQPVYGITAFFLLIYLLASGNFILLGPVLLIIAAKTLFDLIFHLWCIRLYRRWTGISHTTHAGAAVLAALAEPFSFQLLRHSGALLGWWYFLTGKHSWGQQHRHKLSE